MLEAKWQWELAAFANVNMELANVEWDKTEMKWIAHGRAYRQGRALPHSLVPVEFYNYNKLTVDSNPSEVTSTEIAICLTDETTSGEELVSIADIPWNPTAAEPPAVPIIPAEGTSEVTDF